MAEGSPALPPRVLQSREPQGMSESIKSFLVVGVLFPLHILLGICSVPVWLYLIWEGSMWARALFICYLPFYLWPAATRFPGWKGMDAMWRYFDYSATCADYFGRFEVRASAPIDPSAQYFVGCHPHGTLIFQRTFWRSSLLDPIFPSARLRMLGASILFRIPIIREMTLWFGAVDASKANCEALLRQGCTVVVYPGGIDEMPLTGDGAGSAVRLRTRTGFIRLAIKSGVPVLPTFCFGELEAVSAVSPLPAGLAKWLQKHLRMSTTCFLGRWNLFLPRRVPFTLCLGAPIPTRQTNDAAALDAETLRVHALYKQALRDLYESHRQSCGYGGRELVFMCDQGGVTARGKKAQ